MESAIRLECCQFRCLRISVCRLQIDAFWFDSVNMPNAICFVLLKQYLTLIDFGVDYKTPFFKPCLFNVQLS